VATFDGDPDHPILRDPWAWELREFTYRRDPADWHESHIDIVFERGGVVRRLRFFAPQQVRISEGLPNTLGMVILDVRGRQLDGLGVRVANYEQSPGGPEFWAARVVEVID
jgi:hypothetical protein